MQAENGMTSFILHLAIVYLQAWQSDNLIFYTLDF
jgi:hypothetical protein